MPRNAVIDSDMKSRKEARERLSAALQRSSALLATVPTTDFQGDADKRTPRNDYATGIRAVVEMVESAIPGGER